MVYACPSDKVFVTSKNIKRKTVLSNEMKARRNYMLSHKVSIHKDENSNELVAEVIKK